MPSFLRLEAIGSRLEAAYTHKDIKVRPEVVKV